MADIDQRLAEARDASRLLLTEEERDCVYWYRDLLADARERAEAEIRGSQ